MALDHKSTFSSQVSADGLRRRSMNALLQPCANVYSRLAGVSNGYYTTK